MARSVAEHHVRLVAETAQYEAQMRSAAGSTRQLATEQVKAAAASQTGSKAASRFGVVTQQAGYQVQDFAVQIAGGQSAMVAFSQQASQMLGFFGPTGAIAGAIISVGVLGLRILDTAKKTEAAAASVESLDRAYKDLGDARKEAFLARSDQLTNQQSMERDVERLIRMEKSLNDERERGSRLLDEATKMGRGDVRMIFPQGITKEQADAVSSGRATAESVGGMSFNARQLGEYAANLIEQADKKRAEAEVERIAAEEKLREVRERNFQKDRENENELMDINVKRIGAEITAEFKKSEQIEKLDEFRAKKQKDRMESAARTMFDEIYGSANIERTILSLQSRIPEALQVNTGASALGGVMGGSTASQTLDIQKQILESLRTLVRMEQFASSGYN